MKEPFSLEQLVRERLVTAGMFDVSSDEFTALCRGLYDDLELEVGERLSAGLTDAQMDEFDALDEDGGLEFLNRWVPDHQIVVRTCLGELLDRLSAAIAAASADVSENASATR